MQYLNNLLQERNLRFPLAFSLLSLFSESFFTIHNFDREFIELLLSFNETDDSAIKAQLLITIMIAKKDSIKNKDLSAVE